MVLITIKTKLYLREGIEGGNTLPEGRNNGVVVN